jgi:hypothetical protein
MLVGRYDPPQAPDLCVQPGVFFLEFVELALPQMSNLHLAYSRVHVGLSTVDLFGAAINTLR